MKAGHDAAPFVERLDRVHAADEADVQVQARLSGQTGRVRAQRGERVVVAGVEAQHMGIAVEGDGKAARQLGAQRLDLRRQPRLRLALGPQQLVAEDRQAGRPAFLPQQQRLTQALLPPLELAPHVAIRQAQRTGRARDRAAGAHRLQQLDQRVVNEGAAGVGVERIGKTDLVHRASLPDRRWRASKTASGVRSRPPVTCLCNQMHSLRSCVGATLRKG